MKILINDHAGHPFQVQLSRSLASRGHEVLHTYTAQLLTPRGDLKRRDTDPATFEFGPIMLAKLFSRYGLIERVLQERQLGRCLARTVERFLPDVVISANTPLGAQALLSRACRQAGAGFVIWLQDMLGVGIRNNLKKKLPFVGNMIGRYYMALENRLLKNSHAVVVITEDFEPIVQKAGVKKNNIHVIHNWAPLHEVPVMEKNNAWSCAHGLDKTFNFVYSGTLGMKHNPGMLVDLAEELKHLPLVRVVVITEGLGADFLGQQKNRLGLNNLMLLPFQPFEQVPMVQATADVLIAILEPDAGVFAVPSKVLTYLCSHRPLLLAVPPENLAARIVSENNAGIVVSPHHVVEFVEAAEKLFRDQTLRQVMADNGRRYAEITFDIEHITNKFEKLITGING